LEGKRMPKFIVEQYETHVQKYAVEAEDKAEAIKKVMAGSAKPFGELTYLELNEYAGMSTEAGFSDKELDKLDAASLIDRDGGYVFSICSIKEAK